MTSRFRTASMIAAAGVLVLVAWRIGVKPLGDWDEALTGARTLGILETGDWLTVHLNGVPDFHKPPLYYWLAAFAAKAFGASEGTMRLPGAIFAVVLCAELAVLGAWVEGPIAGIFAALTFASTPMFVDHARQAQPDMVLYAATLAALLATLNERYVLAGIAVAIALLAKGLAGLLAPLVIGLWVIAVGRWRILGDREVWLGTAIALLLVAPWIAWNALTHEAGFAATFARNEVAERIVWTSPLGTTGAYYLSVARDALGALPWLALAWPAMLVLDARSARRGREKPALVAVLLVASVVALAATHPKNAHYVLIPALGLALAAGCAVAGVAARPRVAFGGLIALGVVAAGALAAAPMSRPAILPLVLVSPLFALAGAWVVDGSIALQGVAALLALVLGVGAACSLGSVRAEDAPNRALQVLAPEIDRFVRPGETLVVDRTAIQGIAFYARRPIAKVRAFLAAGGRLPDRFFGLFETGIEQGIAGYRVLPRVRAGGLGLYELVRKRGAAIPDGPRFVSRGEDARMVGTLRLLGTEFTELRRHGFVTYVVTRRIGTDGRGLDRSGWRLAGASTRGAPGDAVDGDRSTSWQVGAGDAPVLAVDLGNVQRLTRVTLASDRPGGLPRALSVETSIDGTTWQSIASADTFHPGYRFAASGGIDYAREATVEIGFAPRDARHLRLELPRGAQHAKWRIAELEAYGE